MKGIKLNHYVISERGLEYNDSYMCFVGYDGKYGIPTAVYTDKSVAETALLELELDRLQLSDIQDWLCNYDDHNRLLDGFNTFGKLTLRSMEDLSEDHFKEMSLATFKLLYDRVIRTNGLTHYFLTEITE